MPETGIERTQCSRARGMATRERRLPCRNTFAHSLCFVSFVCALAAARSPPTGSPPARPRRLCLPIHSQLARCVSCGSPSPSLARPPVRLRSRIQGSAPSAEAVATSLLACGFSLRAHPHDSSLITVLALLVVCSLSPRTRLFSCLPACLPFLCDSVCILRPSRLPAFLPSAPSAPSFLR